MRPEGRALFAGLGALGVPDDPLTALWRRGDMLREYRGDSHIAAWVSAGLDATEIGLLTELYWGLPLRTYARTRAWTDEQFDAATERLESKGLIAGDAFTAAGRELRERIEVETDVQARPAIDALGDDVDELFAILAPWGEAIREAKGYPAAGPARPGRPPPRRLHDDHHRRPTGRRDAGRVRHRHRLGSEAAGSVPGRGLRPGARFAPRRRHGRRRAPPPTGSACPSSTTTTTA